MSAALIRARDRQKSSGATGVEPRVNQKEPKPRVDDSQQKSQLATDNNPDSTNVNGITPLMRAAGDGLVDFVQVLLDRGADVNATRNDGFAPLALAAFFGHSQVVRLLLERGADVEATARGTSAEMWADVRGFIGISDLIKKTGGQKETLEPAPIPVLKTRPGKTPAVEEKNSHVVASLRERPLPSNAGAPTERRPYNSIVTAPPSRAAKALPEIVDLPLVIAPEFHPGSVFVARISSSWKNLAALIVVALVIGGMAAFAVPQIARSIKGGQTDARTNTTNLPASTDSVAQPEQSVSSQIETPAPVQFENAAPSNPTATTSDSPSDSKGIESAHPSAPAETQLTTSSGAARMDTTENLPYSQPESRVSNSSEYSRSLSGAKPVFRRTASPRKQKTVSTAKPEQQPLDPDPKPAPLSVEMSRSRTVLSTAPNSGNEGSGSQPSPLSITPNQSKTKVIRWP